MTELQVRVTPSGAAKCERCWHYRDDVGQDAGAPHTVHALHQQPVRRGRVAPVRLMAGKPARGGGAACRLAPAGGTGLATWLGLALLILILDQFTKVMVTGYFQLGDSRTVTSFFNLVRVHNEWRGILVPGGRLRLAALALHRHRRGCGVLPSCGCCAPMPAQRLFAFALSAILGGAIGNLVDRISRACRGFPAVPLRGWYFPSFNIADSAITIGACALILDELLRVRRAADKNTGPHP
jgi:signal peptidase II